jgi:peptidoglycan/LPS O-acetylase OafA/YrhL
MSVIFDKTAAPSQRTILGGLQGLRFIAATSIVFFHLTFFVNVIPHTQWIMIFYNAVRLFFALSAFVLMYQTAPTLGKKNWVQDYLVRRFLRIAPLFYLLLLIDVAIMRFHLGHTLPSLGTVALNLLFLFNLSPEHMPSLVMGGWTVGVEMIFYAVLPVIAMLIRRIESALVFLVLSAALGYFASSFTPSPDQWWTADWNFVANLRWFACGIVSYFIFMRLQKNKTSKRTTAALCGAVCILAIAAHFVINDVQIKVLPIMAFMIAICTWQAYAPSYVLLNSIAQYWGERSYSIYLLHAPLLLLMVPYYAALKSSGYQVVAILIGSCSSVAILFFIAAVTYRFIERPGMTLSRALTHSRPLFAVHHNLAANAATSGKSDAR